MALYQADGFTGFKDSYDVLAGSSDLISTASVDIVLTTGIAQLVFDTLSTSLKCTQYIGTKNIYSLSPDEDITVINLRPKLSILDSTYMNQKMMSSYVFTCYGIQVQATHRSVDDFVSLSEALASVGFRCIGLPWSTDVNPKLETDRADKDRPRIQVVDYVLESPTLPHSNLVDSSPVNPGA